MFMKAVTLPSLCVCVHLGLIRTFIPDHGPSVSISRCTWSEDREEHNALSGALPGKLEILPSDTNIPQESFQTCSLDVGSYYRAELVSLTRQTT